MSRRPEPDELLAYRRSTPAELEQWRLNDLEEAERELETLRDQMAGLSVTDPAFRRVAKRFEDAAQRAHSARNHNAWTWGKGFQ